MVGHFSSATKPSRRDDVLAADEQLRIATQIKAQFDSAAPKRPMKPNQCEPESPTPSPSTVDQLLDNIPDQLHKLRSLQTSHSHTGSGFIRVEIEEEGSFGIQLSGIHGGSNGIVQRGFRSNPATNDWIPKTDDELVWI